MTTHAADNLFLIVCATSKHLYFVCASAFRKTMHDYVNIDSTRFTIVGCVIIDLFLHYYFTFMCSKYRLFKYFSSDELVVDFCCVNLFLFFSVLLCRYIGTAQLMFNGFLKSQGFPQNVLFDPQRPSETISNLLDYIARQHLHTKLSTIVYVKPAVSYVKDLFKLGKARGLLQKFNATELSDKLTDTVNLEVSE